jgi:hypothetical protein
VRAVFLLLRSLAIPSGTAHADLESGDLSPLSFGSPIVPKRLPSHSLRANASTEIDAASAQLLDAARSPNPRHGESPPHNIAHLPPAGETSVQYLTSITATLYVNAKTHEYRRTTEILCNNRVKTTSKNALTERVRELAQQRRGHNAHPQQRSCSQFVAKTAAIGERIGHPWIRATAATTQPYTTSDDAGQLWTSIQPNWKCGALITGLRRRPRPPSCRMNSATPSGSPQSARYSLGIGCTEWSSSACVATRRQTYSRRPAVACKSFIG